jgi:hypothetical protein
MLESLGIGFIPAGSPQAKGRIERLWQTLQDHLVSELRLQGIATPEAAHAFLPAFRADYNRRVARPPARPRPAWRPLPRELPLLPGCRYPRRVAQDNTARLGLRGLPLPPGPRRRSWAGLRVERRALLDGRLVVLHDAHVLPRASPRPSARGRRRRQRASPEISSCRPPNPKQTPSRADLAKGIDPPGRRGRSTGRG